MGNRPKTNNRIRDWKGLLHDESRLTKAKLFLALLILSSSMTFTQFGFIGIGRQGEYLGYALGLLGPLALAALLMGKGVGTLFGVLSGIVLFIHARLQPLDLFERYLVSSLNSVVLYGCAGFMLGLIFGIALHNHPSGKRRGVYLAISCAIASVNVAVAFLFNSFTTLVFSVLPAAQANSGKLSISSEWTGAFGVMGGIEVQVLFDFLLMFVVCLVADHVVRKRAQTTADVSVRTVFQVQLFVVAALVFCVVQAFCFAAITRGSEEQAYEKMNDELAYLDGRLVDELSDVQLVLDGLGPYIADPDDESTEGDASGTHVVPAEVAERLALSHGVTEVLEGYDLEDGTIVIFLNDEVICSYNPAFPEGAKMDKLFDVWRTGTLEELSKSKRSQEMLYDTVYRDDIYDIGKSSQAQLGYMCVRRVGEYYILMAMPSSMVFANRLSTVMWASVTAFALLATIYLLAARLLGKDVISPIDRTNDSLAKITSGNLEETVDEKDNREFTSLSNGINETVGALRGLIDEAERRNEKDLAVAKRIQESALPRTFPPFPEIGAFDIFASMDAAKEVGGDFFDFFLIDDRTLGFLIADVSGKGIPGALFMMAAKTEIENYLSTGMEPAEAIASANRRLCANNDAGMFVTVWAASLDWETGELTYVNAGHNYPLLRRGRSGEWEWLKKKCGLFLGTFERAKYRQETLVLHPGDELILYTDGVNEAFNSDEKEYGNERLETYLTAHADAHPRELVRGLRADVAAWADGAEQSDDVTILALEYGVSPEVTGSLTVPATLDHLGEAEALVTGELERRLCPVGVLNKVAVAIEELFVNVCRYAYEGRDTPGQVTVSYAYGADPSSITVELRDSGIPFDPVELNDPTMPSSIQEAKIGGLGILMVKRTMDDFVYLRDGDQNVVVFKKGW